MGEYGRGSLACFVEEDAEAFDHGDSVAAEDVSETEGAIFAFCDKVGCGEAIFGFSLRIATPSLYQVDPRHVSGEAAGHVKLFTDPREAVRGADLVTTDVWTSMGSEGEEEKRRRAFAGFQVNRELMALARPEALFMHCLPAHRGEEVAADVLESPQSVVWEEAENRLHVQKALMEYLLLGRIET